MIISKGDAMWLGLCNKVSHSSNSSPNLKWDKHKPINPALGRATLPVAEQSLISPPLPVAEPSNGDIPVG